MKNIIFAYRLNKGENPTVSETPYAASNFTLCAFLTEGEYNKRLTELYDQGNENLIKIKGNVPNWEDFVIFKNSHAMETGSFLDEKYYGNGMPAAPVTRVVKGEVRRWSAAELNDAMKTVFWYETI